MEQICLSAPESWGAAITAVVTFFSIAANFVKPDSALGKILHWFALNFSVTKQGSVEKKPEG